MKRVEIFTDGACSGNPGAGGWGAVLRYGSHCKALNGFEPHSTNNRMEMTAVIQALRALNQPCEVTLTTDSKYVVDAINQKWIDQWSSNGWRKKNRQPVQNADLWEEMLVLLNMHQVKFVWVKGHDGHPENEMCDALARASITA